MIKPFCKIAARFVQPPPPVSGAFASVAEPIFTQAPSVPGVTHIVPATPNDTLRACDGASPSFAPIIEPRKSRDTDFASWLETGFVFRNRPKCSVMLGETPRRSFMAH